jgi:hypothetical protein
MRHGPKVEGCLKHVIEAGDMFIKWSVTLRLGHCVKL